MRKELIFALFCLLSQGCSDSLREKGRFDFQVMLDAVRSTIEKIGFDDFVNAGQFMMENKELYLDSETFEPSNSEVPYGVPPFREWIDYQSVEIDISKDLQATNIPPEILSLSPTFIVVNPAFINFNIGIEETKGKRANVLIFHRRAPLPEWGTIQISDNIWFWNGKDTTGNVSNWSGRVVLPEIATDIDD